VLRGEYSHIATRETRKALVVINVANQVMDVHYEEALTTRLERKFQFWPVKKAKGYVCMCVCMYGFGMRGSQGMYVCVYATVCMYLLFLGF
jgi:hypothetical protein